MLIYSPLRNEVQSVSQSVSLSLFVFCFVFHLLGACNTGSRVGLRNRTARPARRHTRMMQDLGLGACGI